MKIYALVWLLLVALAIMGWCLKAIIVAAVRDPKGVLTVFGIVVGAFVTILAAIVAIST